jgi:transglutaminase-like putative cysteine protease
MYYTVRHVTRFVYETPITESVMEVRMQPMSVGTQRCMQFGLTTTPSARVLMYQDHEGNIVHHFNIPGRHSRLTLTAESLVECAPAALVPFDLGRGAWDALDEATASGEFWEYLKPSPFTGSTPTLDAFAEDIGLARGPDPLVLLRRLTTEIHDRFEYSPQSTRVDSPIDDALESRRGVCQDFAHIMIAGLRGVGIPAAYVSGFLRTIPPKGKPRLEGADAMHAWVRVWCGVHMGWVEFDPTNAMIAGPDHITIGHGRDYSDISPIVGVLRTSGTHETKQSVDVVRVE